MIVLRQERGGRTGGTAFSNTKIRVRRIVSFEVQITDTTVSVNAAQIPSHPEEHRNPSVRNLPSWASVRIDKAETGKRTGRKFTCWVLHCIHDERESET